MEQPSSKALFTPAKTQRASEAIYNQIYPKIISGELRPGDRLPPERELAEMFQDNGIFPEDAVVVYCQMGVHAKIACDYLASAGYSKLYLYAGSMNDWMRDSARPVEASSVAFAKAS